RSSVAPQFTGVLSLLSVAAVSQGPCRPLLCSSVVQTHIFQLPSHHALGHRHRPVVAAITVAVLARLLRPRPNFPTGPPGLPLVRNVLDMPSKHPWKVYRQWTQLRRALPPPARHLSRHSELHQRLPRLVGPALSHLLRQAAFHHA
ncbi:hypothetical protein B0H21DRAFT_871469, partial [Amylocystis lapponica]